MLLPAATRYEQEGGGTSTTTERRVAFSPEIPGPRVGDARSEWRIFGDLARRVRPEIADRFGCESGDAIRSEIARVVPAYAGIENLQGHPVSARTRASCPTRMASSTPPPIARRRQSMARSAAR